MLTGAWRTDQDADAKKNRDARARQLRKEGWHVETRKDDYMDLGRFVLYSLDASRPKERS